MEESTQDLMKRWIVAAVQGIKTHTDKDQQKKILEICGRSCAHHDLQGVQTLKSKAKDEEELLKLINEHIPWCRTWIRENNILYSRCTKCGCPLLRRYNLKLDPIFCLCSLGWVKAIFSEAFGNVRVELSKSLMRGDEYCEFRVVLD